MNLFVRHSIDVFNSRYIAGWFLHFFNKEKPVRLRFVSGKEVLGEVVAKTYRKDVQLRRVHPTGFCGFDFNIPSAIDVTKESHLDIYIDSQKKPFRRLASAELLPKTTQKIPPILFMHIPKTAGTSFNSFMRLHVPCDFASHHIENYNKSRYALLAQGKSYLAGHLRIDTLKQCFDIDRFDCYSIVRNPYSHLYSHLNWLKGIALLKGSAFFDQHSKEVKKLAIKIAELDFTKLTQVQRFVVGLRGYELDFFDNCQTRYFLDYRPEKMSLTDFPNTLANIELFKHIGLTEKYDQFRSFISSSYDLPEVSDSAPVNRAMHPPLYDWESEDMKEIFYSLVHADTLLYNTVRNRF